MQGGVRDIVMYPDSFLRRGCLAVDTFDEPLQQLVADMLETVKVRDGAGLAAPQIGDNRKVFVIDTTNCLAAEDRVILVAINPVVDLSGRVLMGTEGCLSFPGVFEDIQRRETVKLTAMDTNGDTYIYEATGFLARAIQHEFDHLYGKLFIDYMRPTAKQNTINKSKRFPRPREKKS
jgi:peptide deformylase